MTTLDFYYWAAQCPHNTVIKQLLNSFSSDQHYQITCHDIAGQPELAKQLNMYSPTLLVFDGTLRWNGPITREIVTSIANGNIPARQPYRVKSSNNLIKGVLQPITEATVLDTWKPCGVADSICCGEKAAWIKRLRDQFQLPHLGFLHYVDDTCVGGAEFVPSLVVPYPVPKDPNTAFLTCSFLSDEQADYRSFPLQTLEEELPGLGYAALIGIASEDVVFPNGPLSWFLERRYTDLGVVNYEARDFARMHVIKKVL